MPNLGLARLRCRQPLLRGARCLHPPSRPCARATGVRVGRDRRPSLPRPWRPHQPGRDQSDLQSDRAGRCTGRLFPGEPRRPPDARAHGDARADTARVPRPRRPPVHDGRAGVGQGLVVPHPRHALRGGIQARPRGGRPALPGLQPLACRGLGDGVPGPHLRRPLHLAGRRGRGGARARMGARPGRPGRRDAGGRPNDAAADRCPPPPTRSTPSGPASTRPASRSSCTPATLGCPPTATR